MVLGPLFITWSPNVKVGMYVFSAGKSSVASISDPILCAWSMVQSHNSDWICVLHGKHSVVTASNCITEALRNCSRRAVKYGGRRSKSSVPKANPWCFVIAEKTPNLPRSRMACCCRAHVPVVGDAVEEVRWPVAHHSEHDVEGLGGYSLQSVVATRCKNFVNGCTFSALHLAANI
jgi:hypothetical protein